ncbi:hypothetical protein JRI60_20630 [Archangium violaceum]|uniref:hypothetical protein n=1 Tax=Archangium violaceum TaxID=83451 RepID=UPI00194E6DD7|nr:hypothetical protein [Archangium violaceum]QRO01259.1 hypothetical protein JRI60_20630 [Archangium violaceum]
MKPVCLSDRKSMFRSFVFVSFFASSLALPSIALAQEGTPQGASTPIRSQRRFALMAEAGWNTLSGVGLQATYHFMPSLSLDMAGGLSASGWKGGARFRYNFLASNFTPFLGAGLMMTGGAGDEPISLDTNNNRVLARVKPAPFAQVVGGLEFLADGGFCVSATAGYAFALTQNPEIVSGTPNEAQRQAFQLLYGNGISLGLALGYAF